MVNKENTSRMKRRKKKIANHAQTAGERARNGQKIAEKVKTLKIRKGRVFLRGYHIEARTGYFQTNGLSGKPDKVPNNSAVSRRITREKEIPSSKGGEGRGQIQAIPKGHSLDRHCSTTETHWTSFVGRGNREEQDGPRAGFSLFVRDNTTQCGAITPQQSG